MDPTPFAQPAPTASSVMVGGSRPSPSTSLTCHLFQPSLTSGSAQGTQLDDSSMIMHASPPTPTPSTLCPPMSLHIPSFHPPTLLSAGTTSTIACTSRTGVCTSWASTSAQAFSTSSPHQRSAMHTSHIDMLTNRRPEWLRELKDAT
jgi:hypothetical protein